MNENFSIKQYLQTVHNLIGDALQSNQVVSIEPFKFNTNYLDKEQITHNIREDLRFKPIFDEIQKYNEHPSVYWFNLVKSEQFDADKAEAALKAAVKSYNIPVFTAKQLHNNSTCLYVGKTTAKNFGRFIQHLGVHKIQLSHGLNLLHWTKEMGLELELEYNVVFFPKGEEWKCIARMCEFHLSQTLNPRIGRHDI